MTSSGAINGGQGEGPEQAVLGVLGVEEEQRRRRRRMAAPGGSDAPSSWSLSPSLCW